MVRDVVYLRRAAANHCFLRGLSPGTVTNNLLGVVSVVLWQCGTKHSFFGLYHRRCTAFSCFAVAGGGGIIIANIFTKTHNRYHRKRVFR